MKAKYRDILSRIREEPEWYDQSGVPRYGEFSPEHCPSIYADRVVLLRIACQACCREFRVEMHSEWCVPFLPPQKLHYGDPPIHETDAGHPCMGNTMNCEDLEVLQVWFRGNENRWERMADLEGLIK